MLDKYKLHKLACSVKTECNFLYENSIIMDDAAIRLEIDHFDFYLNYCKENLENLTQKIKKLQDYYEKENKK